MHDSLGQGQQDCESQWKEMREATSKVMTSCLDVGCSLACQQFFVASLVEKGSRLLILLPYILKKYFENLKTCSRNTMKIIGIILRFRLLELAETGPYAVNGPNFSGQHSSSQCLSCLGALGTRYLVEIVVALLDSSVITLHRWSLQVYL